jgi:hypothetical protein
VAAVSTVATHRQRRSALQRADEVRFAHRDIVRRLREGGTLVAGASVAANMLERPSEHVLRMRVGRFLDACPYLGHRRVRKLVIAAGTSERTKIGELSERQRRLLADMLRQKVETRAAA